jgi:glycosyltransferase involved in cell wall biosynthesis
MRVENGHSSSESCQMELEKIDVSVIMPCLNEAATIGLCVERAIATLQTLNLAGEVVVVDNGSTDGSPEIAAAQGARVIHQTVRGYGSAYLKGLGEACGRYLVIGDSDNTYDFGEIGRFLAPLYQDYDLVMGSRFKGKILPGAMPWSHQYLGNPILTGILNILFRAHVSDAHCGMRALTKSAFERMHLRTLGMEFASEMVIRAAQERMKIAEVPITYYPRGGHSKLRSIPDGWRHLRFMLLYSPTTVLLTPGLALWALGMLIVLLLLSGPLLVVGHAYDVHFMILGASLALLGFQMACLGVYARTYAVTEHLDREDVFLTWFWRHFSFEKGLLIGSFVFLLGLAINLYILIEWISRDFGPLSEVRTAVAGMVLLVTGAQTVFASFFLSMLGIRRVDQV